MLFSRLSYFFFNATATTDTYTDSHTLSLHDALPILPDLKPKHLHQLAKGGPARHLLAAQSRGAVVRHVHRRDVADLLTLAIEADVLERHGDARRVTGEQGQDHLVAIEIGRASCRERVCQYG